MPENKTISLKDAVGGGYKAFWEFRGRYRVVKGSRAFWEIKESPLETTYVPTGQKVYFRGLDDPLKVTSITVEFGNLCWAWIEEAYEVMNENDFNMLDEVHMRGSRAGAVQAADAAEPVERAALDKKAVFRRSGKRNGDTGRSELPDQAIYQ